MRKLKSILNRLLLPFKSRKEYKEELTKEQIRRLNICNKCKYNSDNSNNLTLRNKIYLKLNSFLNKFYGLKVTLNAICMVCGCGLVFLTTQMEEENKCKLRKW